MNVPMPDVEKMCLICGDEFPVQRMYTVNCSSEHRFCFGCIARGVLVAIKGDENSAAHIPACLLANGQGGCNHLMEQAELLQILNLCNSMTEHDETGAAGAAVDDALVISPQERQAALKTIENLFMVSFIHIFKRVQT